MHFRFDSNTEHQPKNTGKPYKPLNVYCRHSNLSAMHILIHSSSYSVPPCRLTNKEKGIIPLSLRTASTFPAHNIILLPLPHHHTIYPYLVYMVELAVAASRQTRARM